MTIPIAVEMHAVHKAYGATRALDGLDLQVRSGSVYGVLGPNGAGKTTAIRVLATLTRPDRGAVLVDGVDVMRDPHEARTRIGLAGQHAAVDEKLTGLENLRMFGRLSHLGERGARRRADELLEQFSLVEAGGRLVKEYSGGMRRRLDLAASLLTSPTVLFLDEPTTGLDPRGRMEVWASIRDLTVQGTTVLLTTQYLDEADHLAAEIGVIDAGRLIASGTPSTLKQRVGGARIEVVVAPTASLDDTAAALSSATGVPAHVEPAERRVSAPAAESSRVLIETVRELDRLGIETEDIAVRKPTLDDVFLELTGSTASSPGRSDQDLVAVTR